MDTTVNLQLPLPSIIPFRSSLYSKPLPGMIPRSKTQFLFLEPKRRNRHTEKYPQQSSLNSRGEKKHITPSGVEAKARVDSLSWTVKEKDLHFLPRCNIDQKPECQAPAKVPHPSLILRFYQQNNSGWLRPESLWEESVMVHRTQAMAEGLNLDQSWDPRSSEHLGSRSSCELGSALPWNPRAPTIFPLVTSLWET